MPVQIRTSPLTGLCRTPKLKTVRSWIRCWLFLACVVACALSLGTRTESFAVRTPKPQASCDTRASSTQGDCAAHSSHSDSQGDAIAMAEPEIRAAKDPTPRSAPPVFGALLDTAQRFAAHDSARLAVAHHSGAELRRDSALFVLRC